MILRIRMRQLVNMPIRIGERVNQMKKAKHTYSREFKEKIIEQYYKGEITAAELASQHQLHVDQIYRWKYELNGVRQSERRRELQREGRNPSDVRYILELEQEMSAYKEKVAELLLQVELLKKVQPCPHPLSSNVSGLEKIKRELGLSKRRAK